MRCCPTRRKGTTPGGKTRVITRVGKVAMQCILSRQKDDNGSKMFKHLHTIGYFAIFSRGDGGNATASISFSQ